jgi:hypothetical protein
MSMRGSVDLQAKSENDHPTQLCRAMGCPIYRRIYIRSTDHNCTCTVISGLFCFIPRKSWIVVSGQCHKKDASCTFELHACSSHDHLVLFLTRTILLFILQIIYYYNNNYYNNILLYIKEPDEEKTKRNTCSGSRNQQEEAEETRRS